MARRRRRPVEQAAAPAEDYELRKILAEAEAPAGYPVGAFVADMTYPTGGTMYEIPVSRAEIVGWDD